MDDKQVKLKIIEVLKADSQLEEPDKIRKYHFGVPPNFDFYPLIWVDTVRGDEEWQSITKTKDYGQYEVVVMDKYVGDPDEANKRVDDFSKNIRRVLKGNTLGGLVRDNSLVVSREKGTVLTEDYAVAGIRHVFRCEMSE